LNENFPAYHLCTAFLASNLSFKFSRQTQKKLVGISHYGNFSLLFYLKIFVKNFSAAATFVSFPDRKNPVQSRW
jgi:hypothetical protein